MQHDAFLQSDAFALRFDFVYVPESGERVDLGVVIGLPSLDKLPRCLVDVKRQLIIDFRVDLLIIARIGPRQAKPQRRRLVHAQPFVAAFSAVRALKTLSMAVVSCDQLRVCALSFVRPLRVSR